MLFKKVFLSAFICSYSVLVFGAEPAPSAGFDFVKQQNLIEAIKAQDIGRVQQLLALGANPNLGALASEIPLKIAAIDLANPDIVALLLHYGADPNSPAKYDFLIGKYGNILLELMKSLLLKMHSLHNKQKTIIKLLLEQPSINLNFTDVAGNTILGAAVKNTDLHEFIPLILNNKLLDPNIPNKSGLTPLMFAMKLHVDDAMRIAKLLLDDNRVEINARDNAGNTALNYAQKSKKLIKLLSKYEALLKKEESKKLKKEQGPAFAPPAVGKQSPLRQTVQRSQTLERPNYSPRIYEKLGVRFYASPHEILGVLQYGSQSEIEEAFKKRLLQWDPSKSSDPDVQDIADLIEWAYKKMSR